MWLIFSSEIKYSLQTLLSFGAVIPFLIFIEFSVQNLSKIYLSLFLFFSIQFWFLNRSKEFRERQFLQLPVSSFKIAVNRLLHLSFHTFFIFGIYLGLYAVLPSAERPDLNILILAGLIILIIYLIAFIIRDLMLSYFRKLGLRKHNVKLILIILFLVLNLLTVYAVIHTKSQGRAPQYFEMTIRFIENNNPFMHVNAIIHFFLIAVMLGIVSIFSFLWKPAYVD